jgi:hypothetical protein
MAIEWIRIGVPIWLLALPASCSRMGDEPPWWPEAERARTGSHARCEPAPSAQPVRNFSWVNPNPSSCPNALEDAGDSGAPAGAPDVAPPGGATSAGAIRNAGQVVAAMREGFRTCYQALLDQRDRCAAGRVDLRFQVDCEGTVQSIGA